MSASLVRLFVAIEPNVDVVEKLVLVQEDLDPILRSRGAKARWIEAPNMHLTMKFIGEVDTGRVHSIHTTLVEIGARHSPFRIDTVGIGAFPSGTKPRIIYAGLSTGQKVLTSLNADLEEGLQAIGIARDRRGFKPHLTIGRIKTAKKRIDLVDVLSALENIHFGYSPIRDIILYRSYLCPKGARYEVIGRVPLPSVS